MTGIITIPVRYEDDYLMVVDKPSGLVVHDGAGVRGDTLVDLLQREHAGQRFDPERAGLVHRLDKGTSGLLLVAKNAATKQQLQRLLRDHAVEKRYVAIVTGVPPRDHGRIEAPVSRHPLVRTRQTIQPGGKEAITTYRIRRKTGRLTLLDVTIETGRMHQIRVHLAALGAPVLGDATYGQPSAELDRPALHAAELHFRHPATGEQLTVQSPLPNDLVKLLNQEGLA